MLEEEVCLFHRGVPSGEEYFNRLHNFIQDTLSQRKPGPVVRFADGEYAFYAHDLHCNGLYEQTESVRAIKESIPAHQEALGTVATLGKIAPLIYPGNIHSRRRLLDRLRGRKGRSAGDFVQFLFNSGISPMGDNYIPFFVTYAYLTSKRFFELIDRKKLCIVSSEGHLDRCYGWFSRLGSEPKLHFVRVFPSYVATRWKTVREEVLRQIPDDVDLCLVGAGIGALLICVDVSLRFSIPAVDAGHVLNMMNDLEEKSAGPRLYTFWKESPPIEPSLT